MKKEFLILFVFASALFSDAQTMQATLKAGSTPRTLDIYVRPTTSFSQKDEAMSFALAVQSTATPAPSLGSSGVTTNTSGPVSGITGIQPNFLIDNLGTTSREVVVTKQTINGNSYYIFTFIFAGTALTNHDWSASIEQLLFSIQLNGCTSNCNAKELLVSLPNGGVDGNSYFYYQSNTLGDITNYTTPFYANELSGNLVNGGSNDGSLLSSVSLSSMVPLPVVLTGFSAKADNCLITLNWQTSLESNVSFFGIERSQDGDRFVQISSLKAKGEVRTNTLYQYNDDNPVNGDIYYRLRIVDKDGRVQFSPTLKQKVNCKSKLDIYPSHTNGTVHIRFPTGYGPAVISILNAAGQMISKEDKMNDLMTLHLDSLSAGSYIIQIAREGRIEKSAKVVLDR